MAKLSLHLSTGEVIRGSGFNSWDEVPEDLRASILSAAVLMFEPVRQRLDKPITILAGGGIRSEEMNERVGGAPNSTHKRGLALDMKCRDPEDIVALFDLCAEMQSSGDIPKGGLSLYIRKNGTPRFVHCDMRGRRARWGTKNRAKVSV